MASHQSDEEKKFHARIVANGKTETSELRASIQRSCSLSEVDVSAVLDALSTVLGEELCQGRQVHLDGIGYFYPTLKCTEEITASTPRRNTKVRLKGIRFLPDKKLKCSIGAVKLEHHKQTRHSEKLSNEEIDIRLKEYFSKHQVMTRRDFQKFCDVKLTLAHKHLRRLLEEGKIKNIGLNTHPIYVLVADWLE